MNFDVYGPFPLPQTDAGLVDNSTAGKKRFWRKVDDNQRELSSSCGVYIYCVRARRGTVPWYVGLTEKRSFAAEATGDRQAKMYDQALTANGRMKKGVEPQLFLLPLHTKTRWAFAKPSKNGHLAIRYLEKYLIGLGLGRNENLLNSKNTKYLKGMRVPGILNSWPGSLPESVRASEEILTVPHEETFCGVSQARPASAHVEYRLARVGLFR